MTKREQDARDRYLGEFVRQFLTINRHRHVDTAGIVLPAYETRKIVRMTRDETLGSATIEFLNDDYTPIC
jgi:hypothetical protein